MWLRTIDGHLGATGQKHNSPALKPRTDCSEKLLAPWGLAKGLTGLLAGGGGEKRGCHYVGLIRGLHGSPASTLMNASILPLKSLWLYTERGLGLLIFCGLGGRQGGLGENGTKEIKKATNINIPLGEMLFQPTREENTKHSREPLASNTLVSQVPSEGPLDVSGLSLPTIPSRSNSHKTQMHSTSQGMG